MGARTQEAICVLATITCLALSGRAFGQRADDNAVTAAEDAFGTSVGFQSVGLYSPGDARGFNPQQAGNLRIEGLYFDQETSVTSDCLVRETTMRVGFAAQSYSFPAPTGIVDLSLRTPGDKEVVSAVLTRGVFDSATADIEAQIPLDTTLGVDLCAGYRRNFAIDVFREGHGALFGTTFRWRPTPHTEIIPFWSYVTGGASRIVPIVYTDGIVTPLPLFHTQDLGTQEWTTWGWQMTTLGVVARSTLAEGWTLAAGLFHSHERDAQSFNPYMTLTGGRTADSVMDLSPPYSNTSTSGELRLARAFTDGAHRRQVQFAVRGRTVERYFGGDAITDLGSIVLDNQASVAQPTTPTTALSHDSTRQLDLGLTYEERWQGVGSLAVGMLNDHYRRTVLIPPAAVNADRVNPWLVNLRVEIEGRRDLLFYSSFVQGLEDSALAPASANNRYEPPPATRTRQVDGGVRWAPAEDVRLIFGAFDIHKPYFNVDAGNIYTQLGRLEYRGLEASLSYNRGGLTVLVGGVRLQPRVERTVPEPGATGDTPLGPVPLTLMASVDYAPPRWGPWAASLQWNRLSPRVATSDDATDLPVLATLAAGVRYHRTVGSYAWTVRLDGFNLTDTRGLHVSNQEVVLPEPARRFMLTVAADL
jgi:iron complex outermembrane receptor protein